MRYLTVVIILCFSFSAFGEKKKPVFRGIVKGDPSPVTGVVMDTETASMVAEQKVKLKDLEKSFELNKKLWEFKEKAYLDGLKKSDKEIQKLSKTSWWDENKVIVSVVLGFVAGSATTYLMYYVVTKTK
jgi:hypothetical protein